jgi:thymidylate synthase (FAD)
VRLIKPYYVIENEINGEKILRHIENAARTCYKSEDKAGDWEKTKKFVGGLIKGGHHSTIEHYSLTVRFIIDRGVSHELVRHRLCAFSQESTRYCNYANDKFGDHITYIIPPWIGLEPGVYDVLTTSTFDSYITKNADMFLGTYEQESWINSLSFSEVTYKDLSKNGWTPQKARSVLPNALKTEIVTTANLREWRHILNMRAVGIAGKPHPQMLELMVPLLKELKEKIPVIFDDLSVE